MYNASADQNSVLDTHPHSHFQRSFCSQVHKNCHTCSLIEHMVSPTLSLVSLVLAKSVMPLFLTTQRNTHNNFCYRRRAKSASCSKLIILEEIPESIWR